MGIVPIQRQGEAARGSDCFSLQDRLIIRVMNLQFCIVMGLACYDTDASGKGKKEEK